MISPLLDTSAMWELPIYPVLQPSNTSFLSEQLSGNRCPGVDAFALRAYGLRAPFVPHEISEGDLACSGHLHYHM